MHTHDKKANDIVTAIYYYLCIEMKFNCVVLRIASSRTMTTTTAPTKTIEFIKQRNQFIIELSGICTQYVSQKVSKKAE